MSNRIQSDLVLKKIVNPTDEVIESLIQAMKSGYESDPLMTRFPISQSTLEKMSPKEYYRIMFLSWIGPALVEGELWIVHPRDQEGEVLGVGIWAVSGKTLSDTPEQSKYKEAYNQLISPEQKEFQTTYVNPIIVERNELYPGIVRDSYHLNNIVTIPSSRGMGVGGALIAEMLRQAREVGKKSSLTAHAEDTRRFYEKQGFKTILDREIEHRDGWSEPYLVMLHD